LPAETAQTEVAPAPSDPLDDPVPSATSSRRLARIGAALGATRQERFGLLMIAAGALAVAYAVLSQLHLA
ncbi:MAG TPA: hypothetical protein VGK33_16330, partial [Chloroflexota bacterium]